MVFMRFVYSVSFLNDHYTTYVVQEAFLIQALREIMETHGVPQNFTKGEKLVHQGQPMEWFTVLLEGKVKIEQNAMNGKSILLCFYHAGTRPPEKDNPTIEQGNILFIGDLELFSEDKSANSTVTAITPVRCCRISASLMARLVAQDASLSNGIAESLARKMDAYSRMSAMNLLYSLKQRYAYYLAVLTDSGATMPIALEETASLLGASTRQLQRVLAELEEEGCLARHGRELRITDRKNLIARAGAITG